MKLGTLNILLALALMSTGAYLAIEARNPKRNDIGLNLSQPVHYVTPQMEAETREMARRLEPTFQIRSELGKPLVVAPRGAQTPQVVLFIKDACPCSIDAQPIFNDLARKFADKVQFVGIIDGDAAAAKAYASQFSVAFPVGADPRLQVIHGFAAQAGVFSALVDGSGRLIKMWPGYSVDLLNDMNQEISRAADIPVKPFNPEYAPVRRTTGCAYAPASTTFR